MTQSDKMKEFKKLYTEVMANSDKSYQALSTRIEALEVIVLLLYDIITDTKGKA